MYNNVEDFKIWTFNLTELLNFWLKSLFQTKHLMFDWKINN